MKYIVFAKEMKETTHLIPVMFPDNLVHRNVSRALRLTEELQGYKPIRAGFVELGQTLTAGGITKTFPWVTHGESETLGLKSDPSDATLIMTYAYTGGMVT